MRREKPARNATSHRQKSDGACDAAGVDAEQKRELKRAFKEQEKATAREAMVLDEEQLNNLLDFLDERLPANGCDHSLRLSREWAASNAVDADMLALSLEHFGGFCDCEVVANVEPESIF